ncbi:MAG: ABC transporter permease, partial [Burkholderiaceae bacterium]|nr:ABC transporter permease [Burkholderiaceae bacterium]
MNRIPSFLALGWRTLRRDLRAGELRLLMTAVLLAVAALTAVGFFADRVQTGLARTARALLGGDAVVASDHPLAAAWTNQAATLGLAHTLTLTFATMARAGQNAGQGSGAGAAAAIHLVALKAVSASYPLRGSLRTTTRVDDWVGQATQDVPATGAVWVDASLLTAFG